jgi:hypothetical protein
MTVREAIPSGYHPYLIYRRPFQHHRPTTDIGSRAKGFWNNLAATTLLLCKR